MFTLFIKISIHFGDLKISMKNFLNDKYAHTHTVTHTHNLQQYLIVFLYFTIKYNIMWIKI